jgi:uncharacterized protein YqeY
VALKDQLDADLQAATRDEDPVKLAVVRTLKGAIKYREIEHGRPLDDAGVLQVIAQEIKRHRDSIEQHRADNRPDLVEKEEGEIAVLQAWQPAQVTGR